MVRRRVRALHIPRVKGAVDDSLPILGAAVARSGLHSRFDDRHFSMTGGLRSGWLITMAPGIGIDPVPHAAQRFQ